MTEFEEIEFKRKSIPSYTEFFENTGLRAMPVYHRTSDFEITTKILKLKKFEVDVKSLYAVDEHLKFSIRNYDFYLNPALKQIHNAIEESQTMFDELTIEECGKEPDFESYINSIQFLCAYANCLYLKEGKAMLKPPYIDAVSNGDVYLDWKTEKAEFLIIFKKDKDISYFFGQSKVDGLPFKSAVNNKGPVKDFLLHWFKENLCY